MRTISSHLCFGGTLGIYAHSATSTACEMRFSVFVPPALDAATKRPAVVFLSGLTCTEENFTAKAGAYRVAAELGLAVIVPDTSPRGEGVAKGDSSDIGLGAGFYIDATQAPWNAHYKMETYVAHELHALMGAQFPIDTQRVGLFGHSMGGHGALTLFQKHPNKYKSLSAFAPICAPSVSTWGQGTFAQYLGPDRTAWAAHDATQLLLRQGPVNVPILIDQGQSDPFLDRLTPEAFEAAATKVGQRLNLRRHAGYDHGYFFIQTFIEDHLRHHADSLNR